MSNTPSITQNLDEQEKQWLDDLYSPDSPTAPKPATAEEPKSQIPLNGQEDPLTAVCGLDFYEPGKPAPIFSLGFTNEDDRDFVYFALGRLHNDPLWPPTATNLKAWERMTIRLHQKEHYDPHYWDRLQAKHDRRRRNPITGRFLGGDRPRSNGGL